MSGVDSVSLGKLVTKKPVVFVVFDNRVEFDKKRQVNDNRVEFDKFTFCRIRQKKKFVIQIQMTNLTFFSISKYLQYDIDFQICKLIIIQI